MAHKPHNDGRPQKYKTEYCQMLIDHMAEGYSFESFAGVINVSQKLMYDWCRRFPEFLYAKQQGRQKSLLKWEKLAFEGMWYDQKRPFNSTVWIFSMKNKFNWKDKVENEQKVELDIPSYKLLNDESTDD